MQTVQIAVLGRDPHLRRAAARAFDHAPRAWDVRLHTEAIPPEADVVVLCPDIASGRQIDGSLLFDPADPESILDRIAAVIDRSHTRRFVVTSAGGGVGVTSVALHLAGIMAATHQTLLVDLDPTHGSASRLGLPIEADLAHPERWTEDVESICLPMQNGARLLLPPADWTSDEVQNVLADAGKMFERVVVDAASASHSLVIDPGATVVCLVAPNPTCAMRTRALVELLPAAEWAFVLNRVGPGGEISRLGFQRLLGYRIAMEIPCSPRLRDAEDRNSLLTAPWSRWHQSMSRLARTLERA